MATKSKTADKATGNKGTKANATKSDNSKGAKSTTAAKSSAKSASASKGSAPKKSTAANTKTASSKTPAKKPVGKTAASQAVKTEKKPAGKSKTEDTFKKPVATKVSDKTISKAKELAKGEVGRVGKEKVSSEPISSKANRDKTSDKPATKPEATTLAKGKDAKKATPAKPKAKAETNMSVPPEASKGAVAKKAPIPKTVARPGEVRKEPIELIESNVDNKNVDKNTEDSHPEIKSPLPKHEKNRPVGKRVLATKPTPAKTVEDNRTRFSDEELQEFREIIHKKLADARKDFELLKDSLSNQGNGTDDTSPTFKLLEDGSDVLTKEETAQLAVRQQKFIQNLEMALVRIENKTYGICRATGKLISKERLRVVPHATLSIEAKSKQ
jgi:DnaK suppressor protein